jgi:hypothetical protein
MIGAYQEELYTCMYNHMAVVHHQAARAENPAPEAATTATTDNPIMSGTPGHRRLPLLFGVVQHLLEARLCPIACWLLGKNGTGGKRTICYQRTDGMIMIGSQVYMMFTTTRQQGESPATWLLEMKLVFQRQSASHVQIQQTPQWFDCC